MKEVLRTIRRAALTRLLVARTRSRWESPRSSGPLVSLLVTDPALVEGLGVSTRYQSVQLVSGQSTQGEPGGAWSWSRASGPGPHDLLDAADGELIALVLSRFRPVTPGWLGALVDVLEQDSEALIAATVAVRPGRRVDGVQWEFRMGREEAWPGSWIGGLDVVAESWRSVPHSPRPADLVGGPVVLCRRELLMSGVDEPLDEWFVTHLSRTAAATGKPPVVVPAAMVLSDLVNLAVDLRAKSLPAGARRFAGRWAPQMARDVRLRALDRQPAGGERFERTVGGSIIELKRDVEAHPFLEPSGRVPVGIGAEVGESWTIDGFELITGSDPAVLAQLDRRIAARCVVVADPESETPEPALLQAARQVVLAPRIGWRIGPRSLAAVERWGDTHLARHLAAAFKQAGFASRISPHPYWDDPSHQDVDVVVHLQGLRRYRPKPAHYNILWVISHPERMTPDTLHGFDLALVASHGFASELRQQSDVPVAVWLQSTNPHLFLPGEEERDIPLLFVGNSRDTDRPMVRWAVERGLPLTVYGGGWEGRIPQAHVAGETISNHRVPGLYRRARAVLNDHWPDMAAHGFISNRTFDVLACGTPLISDNVKGLDELFPTGVSVVETADDLEVAYRAIVDNGAAAERAASAAGQTVLSSHTTHVRVAQLLEILTQQAADVPKLREILERRSGSLLMAGGADRA